MLTPEQTNRIAELYALVAPYQNSFDPSFGAYLLLGQAEVKKYDLYTLTSLLSGGQYGCHKNDIIGVIELIQKHMENENEVKD